MSDAKQVVLTLNVDGVGIEIGDGLDMLTALIMLSQGIQGVTQQFARALMVSESPIVSASGTIPVA